MTADETEALVRRHYAAPGLDQNILDALRRLGRDPTAIADDDLDAVDHFHIGGKLATLTLIAMAGLQSGMHVLDVGGGLGGPARSMARLVKCSVTVLDLNPDYCRAGEELTTRAGFADSVHFHCGSALALPFSEAAFDAAWTQHSSMNIEDKAGLYRELHRVLKPQARLAMHEVMAGPTQAPHFPVPWADDGSISFLRPPTEIRAVIADAGFRELIWQDVTEESLDWFRAIRANGGSESPSALGMQLVLGDRAGAAAANLVRNLSEGRASVIRGVFSRQ